MWDNPLNRIKIGKPEKSLAYLYCGFQLCSFANEIHLHPRNLLRLTPKTTLLNCDLRVRLPSVTKVLINSVVVVRSCPDVIMY
jgi:hypothetical protein